MSTDGTPVTQHPEVQLDESATQLTELENIGTHAHAMLTATHGIVGTPDWSGPTATTAAQVVDHFVKNTVSALEEMTHRTNSVKNLANLTQEHEAHHNTAVQNMPLPSFHR